MRAGERVLIVDRGRPVARLEPAPSLDEDPDGRLGRLQRAGLAEASDTAPPLDVAGSRPPRPKKGASALAALIAQRRAGC